MAPPLCPFQEKVLDVLEPILSGLININIRISQRSKLFNGEVSEKTEKVAIIMNIENSIDPQMVDREYELSQPMRSANVWAHPGHLIRVGPQRAVPKSTKNAVRLACFRSEERFFCRETECVHRTECIRLVAAWRR